MAKSSVWLSGSLLLLVAFWAASYFVVVPLTLNLIAHATLIVFVGCHYSLVLLPPDENEEDDKAEGAAKVEAPPPMTMKDAALFPVIGSASLLGLYLAIKYLDKFYVETILSLYFSLVGVATMSTTFSPLFSSTICKENKSIFYRKWNLGVLGDLEISCTQSELISLVPACIFAYYYFMTKHYMLNNVLGISFCIQALSSMSVGSYKIGAILLIGLFFYDIFWVFGTDVMVTVAMSIKGPVMLKFPKVLPSLENDYKGEFSILGLGDIVLPGIFIALLLRLDAIQARKTGPLKDNFSFSKPYFHSNIVGYMAGLLITVNSMFFFNAAQPALLYLVPMCIGCSVIMAASRGELMEVLFPYDEADFVKAEKSDEMKADSTPAQDNEDKKIK